MRRISLLLALMFGLTMLGAETGEFSKVYTDGKSWDFVRFDILLPEGGCTLLTERVVGDTVVDGRTCKQIMGVVPSQGYVYYKAVYEDGGKVYEWHDGQFKLDMDFGLSTDDERNNFERDVVDVRGVKRQRLKFSGGVIDSYWVEDIGKNNGYATLLDIPVCGQTEFMLECRQDGMTIFTKDDFDIPSGGIPADYDYRPMVEKGRSWWYSYPTANGGQGYFSLTLGESVDMEGIEWTKCLFSDAGRDIESTVFCYLREDNGRIYFIPGSSYDEVEPLRGVLYNADLTSDYGGAMIYDFGLGVLDIYECVESGYASCIKKINYERQETGVFRVQSCFTEFIEGVGVTEPGYVFCCPGASIDRSSPLPTLLWVTDADDNVYYEAAGGVRPWETQGLSQPMFMDEETVSVVDMLGRPVSAPRHGIFIVTRKNGGGVTVEKVKYP